MFTIDFLGITNYGIFIVFCMFTLKLQKAPYHSISDNKDGRINEQRHNPIYSGFLTSPLGKSIFWKLTILNNLLVILILCLCHHLYL